MRRSEDDSAARRDERVVAHRDLRHLDVGAGRRDARDVGRRRRLRPNRDPVSTSACAAKQHPRPIAIERCALDVRGLELLQRGNSPELTRSR